MRPSENSPGNAVLNPAFVAALTMGLVAVGAGCTVPVHQQRLLAKPGMQFTGSAALGAPSKLLPQVESGAATSGGGQAAGCSSCR
jgi:hypothetical protein